MSPLPRKQKKERKQARGRGGLSRRVKAARETARLARPRGGGVRRVRRLGEAIKCDAIFVDVTLICGSGAGCAFRDDAAHRATPATRNCVCVRACVRACVRVC